MAVSRKHKTILKILFAAYLVLLIYFLFFSDNRTGINTTNWELFAEIRRDISNIRGNGKNLLTAVINLFGNILAFMPLGFFLPALFGKWQNWLVVVAESYLLSLLVEEVQFISHTGVFDVDDIFLNTLGGLFGYIGYRLAYILYKNMHKIIKKGTKRKG